MNPLKLFKDSLPSLAKVLESIHAHLELQLEVQQKILKKLEDMGDQKVPNAEKDHEKNIPENKTDDKHNTEDSNINS